MVYLLILAAVVKTRSHYEQHPCAEFYECATKLTVCHATEVSLTKVFGNRCGKPGGGASTVPGHEQKPDIDTCWEYISIHIMDLAEKKTARAKKWKDTPRHSEQLQIDGRSSTAADRRSSISTATNKVQHQQAAGKDGRHTKNSICIDGTGNTHLGWNATGRLPRRCARRSHAIIIVGNEVLCYIIITVKILFGKTTSSAWLYPRRWWNRLQHPWNHGWKWWYRSVDRSFEGREDGPPITSHPLFYDENALIFMV